jgi:hypothetical protein
VRVWLVDQSSDQALWVNDLTAEAPLQQVRSDVTVKRGQRLHLIFRSLEGKGKWSARAGWTIALPQETKAE